MEHDVVRARIRIGLIGGFALLTLACAMLVVAMFASIRAEHWVDHSLRIKQRTEELFSMVQDAETGQRGYLLTGDISYLTPFVKAKADIPPLEQHLREITATNSEDQLQLDRLYPIIAAKIDELSRTVQMRRAEQTEQALALLKTNLGRDEMEQIRALIGQIERGEQALLDKRVAAASAQRLYLTLAIALTIALAGLLAAVAAREGRQYSLELHRKHVALQAEMQQRETAEMQLRQAQKMEALGQLTGGVAHDFNNMLAIIVGNVEMLLRRLPENDTRCRNMAGSALSGAMRAAELTKRLLAFSRQQPLQPKTTDVNQCVRDISSMLRRSLGEDVEIETIQAGGLWPAYVDRPQLESAILNLAVNSRDAMKGRGHLTIETANALLDRSYADSHDEVAPGQYVMVAVTDTGEGMPPDVLRKAFDPFFTTKDVGKGTGLGLSQVHGFSKQSRGHAKIYSEVGVGTTVKIYLPRDTSRPQETSAAPPIAAAAAAAMQGKVLVVEDDADVRGFVLTALQELGYDTAEADSAEAARARLASDADITILLTDVVMPGVSGKQLVDAVKNTYPALVVVFMTGYTRNAIVHNGMLDQGVRLISKPFTINELARELRAAVAGSAAASDSVPV